MQAVSQDQASLDNLHDIVVPEPVTWWPPAPGWYLLGALILFAASWFFINAIENWWKNRYRGAAIKELNQLRHSTRKLENHELIRRLNDILKRVTLNAWPREEVATLSGEQWLEFLTENANLPGNGTAFGSEQTRVLRDAAYSKKICNALSSTEMDEIFSTAEHWIRRHEASSNESSKRWKEGRV